MKIRHTDRQTDGQTTLLSHFEGFTKELTSNEIHVMNIYLQIRKQLNDQNNDPVNN